MDAQQAQRLHWTYPSYCPVVASRSRACSVSTPYTHTGHPTLIASIKWRKTRYKIMDLFNRIVTSQQVIRSGHLEIQPNSPETR